MFANACVHKENEHFTLYVFDLFGSSSRRPVLTFKTQVHVSSMFANALGNFVDARLFFRNYNKVAGSSRKTVARRHNASSIYMYNKELQTSWECNAYLLVVLCNIRSSMF